MTDRILRSRWHLAGCLLTAGSLALQAQTVQIQYAPPPGTPIGVQETVTRVTTEAGGAPVTDVRVRQGAMIPVPMETGYANGFLVASSTLSRNGNAIVSPVLASMTGLTLSYVTDPAGRLVDIRGYEQLSAAMSQLLPEKLATTLSSLLSVDLLKQRDMAAYNEVHGPYAGGSIQLGAEQISVAAHELPHGGTLPLFAVTSAGPGDDGTTVQIGRTFNSDANALAAQFESVTAEALTGLTAAMTFPDLQEQYASATVSGSEQVVVQVNGALVSLRRKEMNYSVSRIMPAGGDAVPFELSVVEVYGTGPVPEGALPASD